VVLKRRPRPRILSYASLPNKSFGLDENIPLPFVGGGDGYLSVSLDLRPTILGTIVKVLYKAPEMHMTIIRRDGSRLRYRLIPEVLSKGVIISPIVSHLSAWMQMFTGLGKKQMNADYIPESVMFSGGKWFCYFYDCQASLKLKQLTVSTPKQ